MQHIIFATSNKGKIREFEKLLGCAVQAYSDILGHYEIVEDGDSFKANAIIKAQDVYDKLKDEEAVVVSDDSGISVPSLGGVPGIYSARFAGKGASDKDNLYKLIDQLKQKDIKRTPAYYTACIAIASKYGVQTVHGWMHGDVIDEPRGEKGFGYDPMFIPKGYDLTLGELDDAIKKSISHRSQALNLAMKILK
jgi:XTP/dITP diphosphohydrolase